LSLKAPLAPPSGYSRRGDRSPRLCCRTGHERFHLTRLLRETSPVMGTLLGLCSACWRLPRAGPSIHRALACSRLLQRYSSPARTSHRPHVSLSAGFPHGLGFLRNPPTGASAVAPCSWLSPPRGSSVPHHRLAWCGGPHASPGVSGVSLRRLQTRSALLRAVLAVANHPRRRLPPHDDAPMGSSACPCTALLGGSLNRILRDRLLSPLGGLRVSRYRRG